MSELEIRYKRSQKLRDSRKKGRDSEDFEYKAPKKEPYKKQNKYKMRANNYNDFITDDD